MTPPNFDTTQPCMVCGEPRPDALISVARRMVAGWENQYPRIRVHVRYCNDRPGCAVVACAPGIWPFATGEGTDGSTDRG